MNTLESSLAPPRGMRDFYPEEMAVRNLIFDAWRTSARRFGFLEYDACVVENLELLTRKAGEEIVEQIYTFTDKSGRPLALRPEITPTLARMVAARYGSLAFPLKWFTVAQCFRYERMSRGRKREHYQWNLDIIGEPTVSAEAETVAAAVHALSILGLRRGDFFIHFSSRALLTDFLTRLRIPPPQHSPIFIILDKRSRVGEAQAEEMFSAAGIDRAVVRSLLDLANIASLQDAVGFLGFTPPSCANMRVFLDLLDAYGIPDYAKFDLSIVRGLDYYTGIVFEAFDAHRKFRAILGGGRYDSLLSQVGGKDASAVGLGFGDVVVAEILADKNLLGQGAPRSSEVAVGYMQTAQRGTAISVATALRSNGRTVDLALREEKAKAFFARAGKGAFRKAIYIGPDDVARNTLRVKDLTTRTEEEVRIETLTASATAPNP